MKHPTHSGWGVRVFWQKPILDHFIVVLIFFLVVFIFV
jgi:hypothetical protein